MVKKEQKPDPELPKNPLVQVLEGLQKGQQQMLANMQQLGKNDKILSERIDAMEKNPPKKDIMEQITTIINLADKLGLPEIIKGALSGGEEEKPIQQTQIPPEGYDHFVKFTKSMQDMILGQQTEMVRAMKLKNDQAEKELGADF